MLKYFRMLQKITAWMIIQPSIGNGVMTPAVVNDGTPFHFSFVVMLWKFGSFAVGGVIKTNDWRVEKRPMQKIVSNAAPIAHTLMDTGMLGRHWINADLLGTIPVSTITISNRFKNAKWLRMKLSMAAYWHFSGIFHIGASTPMHPVASVSRKVMKDRIEIPRLIATTPRSAPLFVRTAFSRSALRRSGKKKNGRRDTTPLVPWNNTYGMFSMKKQCKKHSMNVLALRRKWIPSSVHNFKRPLLSSCATDA